jgi:anaerobic magnesium-protoporphyrin IX monomethyl ester cyclase
VRGVAASVQTKKGCVLECIFCSNFLIDGTGVKLRDPSEVVDEIAAVAASGGTAFEVVDGVFNLPLHHALAVLREMERRRLSLEWTCMINPGAVSPELVERMAATGCTEIELGTDSGDDEVLRRLKKNFRRRRIEEVHRWFEAAGIRITHCLFIGSPGDSRASLFATFDLLDRLVPAGHPDHRAYWTLGQRIAPRTGLHRIAVEEGLLEPADRLLVPRYYIEPRVLADERLIDDIERRVTANLNWYLWWGLGRIPLRQRIADAQREQRRLAELYGAALAGRRREGALAAAR